MARIGFHFGPSFLGEKQLASAHQAPLRDSADNQRENQRPGRGSSRMDGKECHRETNPSGGKQSADSKDLRLP